MLLKILNPNVDNEIQTFLTSPVGASAGTVLLPVKNSAGFVNGNYMLLGGIGEEKTEIVQINAAISSTTSISVSSTKLDHATDTPVTFIRYNKIQFYKSSNGGVTYSLLAANDLQVDRPITTYSAQAVPTDLFKTRFFNSTTSQASIYSAVQPATGFVYYNLVSIINRVLDLFPDPNEQVLSRGQITDWINEEYRRLISLASKIDQGIFMKSNASSPVSMTAGTALYDLPEDFKSMKKLEIANDGVNFYRAYPTHEGFGWPSQVYDPTAPLYIMVANQFEIRPTPIGGKYRMWYYYIPNILSQDDDKVDLAIRPYLDALVDKALARGKQKDKKYDEAQYWDVETEKVEEMMVNELTNRTSLDIPRWVDISDTSFMDSDDNWLWEM